MSIITRNLIATALAIVLAASPVSADWSGYGKNMKITPIEVAQLPQFCWKQMDSPFATGPAFTIPAECGVGMNHYCPGLLQFIRAKKELDTRKRLGLLGDAEQSIRYTLRAMQEHPKCPIRRHVEATQAEMSGLRKLWEFAK
jgi:hypothetical protein